MMQNQKYKSDPRYFPKEKRITDKNESAMRFPFRVKKFAR
ncbi:hypothetical protein B4110_3107 [Parageobacillus toebii]|jgi:hypothetical protein|uniref:Uncharacterized protein n=1 Tax=Parageobacillus toebii TaxID=153151 RepID=A0A150MYB2_9BACL|nr:hypothetical protein B4110_3107 [Parageobacillus toebii]